MRSGARTARGTPPGGTRGRATDCPSARRPWARASARSASRHRPRRPVLSARGCARAWRRDPGCVQSSAGRRRSRRRPARARPSCARRRPGGTWCGRARRPQGWHRHPPRTPPSAPVRPTRSPRRRRDRRRGGRARAARSTRRRRGGAGTSSSPPGRRGACARPSGAGAAPRAAGHAGRRAR